MGNQVQWLSIFLLLMNLMQIEVDCDLSLKKKYPFRGLDIMSECFFILFNCSHGKCTVVNGMGSQILFRLIYCYS